MAPGTLTMTPSEHLGFEPCLSVCLSMQVEVEPVIPILRTRRLRLPLHPHLSPSSLVLCGLSSSSVLPTSLVSCPLCLRTTLILPDTSGLSPPPGSCIEN